MDLHFQYIEYLLLLALVPLLVLLYFFVLQWKKRTIKKIGDERLVREVIRNYSPQKFALKFILVLVAFAAIVVALANPRSKTGTEKVNRNGIDVMIALDVSKSMLAQDIKPTRLERAKQLLGKLIDKLSNDRVGIVVFAGRAYLQMPLTGDHGAAKMYLSAASPDAVPTQGTVIADALKMCYAAFNEKEKKYKSVVLISDGEDHDEGALKAAEQMAEEGIVINTVGIGSPTGATIIDETTNEPKKDNNGNIVITRLNEEELRDIATKGNGIYQLFKNADEAVATLDARMSTMDQRTVTEDSLINYKNFFQLLAAVALLLLLIEMLISERRNISPGNYTVSARKVGLTFIAYCLFPATSFSQNDNALIKGGNESYSKKEYDKAIAEYQKVTAKNPANKTAQYNLGNALYKSKRSDDAITAYETAISNADNGEDKSKSFYNKGVVLQNNKKIPECIDAYKHALKLNPDDEDARQNLQKAMQQIKQQQKQKDNKEQKKPKEDQKQQDKQKTQEEKNDQPKPQPSKLTRQDAEEKLKALLQQEKNLQGKLRKVNEASPTKPEKDW